MDFNVFMTCFNMWDISSNELINHCLSAYKLSTYKFFKPELFVDLDKVTTP